jgi:negative regulator of flagellin synthesis FlgM
MIDGVGKSGTGRIDLSRQEKGAAVSPLRSDGLRAPGGAVQSAVLELVSGGAPVDSARVEAVRAAIREGRYPLDPDRIAQRMLDLDLPRRG